MPFYNIKQQLYLETDPSGICIGVSLLQVRDKMQFPKNETLNIAALWSIAFASKILTSTETFYNNIKGKTLGILHCSACEVSITSNS